MVLWYSRRPRTFYCTSCAANFSPESCKSRINSVLCLNTPLPWQDDIPNGKFQLPFLSSTFVDSFYGISYRPGKKACFFCFFVAHFPLSQDFNSMELLVDSKDDMRLSKDRTCLLGFCILPYGSLDRLLWGPYPCYTGSNSNPSIGGSKIVRVAPKRKDKKKQYTG